MKAVILSFSLLLAACSSPPTPVVKITPVSIPRTTLSEKRIDSVRYAENIKAYPLGRYIDPSNPLVMHEGHPVYRMESTSKWNLHPGQSTLDAIGPISRIRDSSQSPAPINGQIIAELNRQKEATKAVIQGGQAITQKLGNLASSIQQTKLVAEENAQLKAELVSTKIRLDALEEAVRNSPITKTPTKTGATPPDNNHDW